MSRKRFFWPALVALTAFFTIAMAAVAVADNVKNDVVAGGTDTITSGGSTTINYFIQNSSAGGSGFSGCDASDGSSAAVTISAPSGVTATPGSLTFTSCDTNKPVVFSSSTVGTYNITVSVSDSHGNYNVNGATFTLTVNALVPTNTAPDLTLPTSMTVEGNTLGGADVTYTGISASDTEDGDLTSSVTCVPSSGSFFAVGGPYEVDCSVMDSDGAETSGFFNVFVEDTTAPTIASHADITAEATSAAGAGVNYTAPATSDAVDSPSTATCSPASGSTFPLDDTTVTCNASDAAGNAATPTTFKVTVQDTTAPTIDAHADVSVSATGPSGAVVNYTSPATHDAVGGDGTATCTPASGSTFPIGDTTVTCNATDAAGNAATATTFKVHVSLTLNGFYAPVDMGGVWNTVKGGSTVPFKFEIFAGTTELIDIAVVTGFTATQLTCPSGTFVTDSIEVTATGGTSLRYDTTAGQFVYNWQTPKKPGKCYGITMTTQEGSTLSANFILK